MKYGYCVNMLSSQEDGTGCEWIRLIGEMGFDYVELPLAQMMDMDDAAFECRILLELKQSGVQCLCCNNFFPASYRLTGPNADHEKALRYADAAIHRARSIGAKRIVFGSSGARNIPVGFPKEKAREQITDFIRRLGDVAQTHGVALALEPLNPFESNILNGVTECGEIVRSVGVASVRLLADSFHMRMVSEPPSLLANYANELEHVHIARTLGRSLPCDGDEDDWNAFFESLKQIGYEGCVSIEANAPVADRRSNIEASLKYIKSFG